MMVTLLVYAYSVEVCSSRRVAAACERNLAFRAIVGDDPPDFRAISDFRKIHLAAFRPLFLEALPWLARWVWSSLETCPPTGREGSERLAAQGDELRLHEQGNPAAGS